MSSAYFTKRLKVPDEFPEILKSFTREILRNQPSNIYEFGANYFAEMSAQVKLTPRCATLPAQAGHSQQPTANSPGPPRTLGGPCTAGGARGCGWLGRTRGVQCCWGGTESARPQCISPVLACPVAVSALSAQPSLCTGIASLRAAANPSPQSVPNHTVWASLGDGKLAAVRRHAQYWPTVHAPHRWNATEQSARCRTDAAGWGANEGEERAGPAGERRRRR
jgi:hypothetical protein